MGVQVTAIIALEAMLLDLILVEINEVLFCTYEIFYFGQIGAVVRVNRLRR